MIDWDKLDLEGFTGNVEDLEQKICTQTGCTLKEAKAYTWNVAKTVVWPWLGTVVTLIPWAIVIIALLGFMCYIDIVYSG